MPETTTDEVVEVTFMGTETKMLMATAIKDLRENRKVKNEAEAKDKLIAEQINCWMVQYGMTSFEALGQKIKIEEGANYSMDWAGMKFRTLIAIMKIGALGFAVTPWNTGKKNAGLSAEMIADVDSRIIRHPFDKLV